MDSSWLNVFKITIVDRTLIHYIIFNDGLVWKILIDSYKLLGRGVWHWLNIFSKFQWHSQLPRLVPRLVPRVLSNRWPSKFGGYWTRGPSHALAGNWGLFFRTNNIALNPPNNAITHFTYISLKGKGKWIEGRQFAHLVDLIKAFIENFMAKMPLQLKYSLRGCSQARP